MANNVTVIAFGGQPQVISGVSTVKDVLTKMNATSAEVKVNGQTVDENHTLPDYAFVSLGAKVKGGIILHDTDLLHWSNVDFYSSVSV